MLDKNGSSSLIRDILDIRLPMLEHIDLTFNHIASLEGISTVYMPVLKRLYLGICTVI